MAELKTKATEASVEQFLDGIDDEQMLWASRRNPPADVRLEHRRLRLLSLHLCQRPTGRLDADRLLA